MTRPPTAVMFLLSLGLLVAGCDSGDPKTDRVVGVTTPDAQRLELIQRADLDPCPETSPQSADDGLPDLTLPCLGDGPVVHVSGLRGKPTVVNIWGSWCGPCQEETPILSRAYDDLAPRVRFLGIDTLDDPDSALDFAVHVEPRMRYPSIVDDDKSVLIAVGGSHGPPVTVFVDASGRIVGTSYGPYLHDEDLRADIAEYFGDDYAVVPG